MDRRRTCDVAGLTLGTTALIVSAVLARRGTSEDEARVFRWANQLPDDAFPVVWVPMQYGAFGTAPALAALALARHRPRLALALAGSGAGAWLLAKAVKPVVGRGRPATALGDVRSRGKEEGDLGFPSGHAAVSAALTLVAWPYLGPRLRIASATLSVFVPVARLYVGAHLPLDVLGGSALGVAVACLVDAAVGPPGWPRRALRTGR